MKRFVALCAVAGSLAVMSTPSEAAFCRANSRSANGWGRSGSLYEAKRIALVECAVRTPRYQTCYITSCSY